MGWDGFAHPKPKGDQISAFKDAAADVKARTGSVDGLLMDAIGLDCSDCAFWMEVLTGWSAYKDWTPEEMEERYELAKMAAEHEHSSDGDAWAKESALAFMRLCSQFGMGMRVSF